MMNQRLLSVAGLALLTASSAAQHQVDIDFNSFSPDTLTIEVGDWVTWENDVFGVSRRVLEQQGAFDSGPMFFGSDFTVHFHASFLASHPRPGNRYQYFEPSQGFTGVVIVEPGTSYCGCDSGNAPCANASSNGCVNSTGLGATLSAEGSNDTTFDDLVLHAGFLPPNQFAVFFMGPTSQSTPFRDGQLCVSGGFFRFNPPQPTGGGTFGSVSLGPGIVAHSQANFGATGAIGPGSTWHFQAWFRDPNGPCGTGSNLTDAYRVEFE